MNIYEALLADHNQLKPMLDRLVAASRHDESTKALLEQIHDALIPHSRAEEAVFYNALRGLDATQGLIGGSYKDHMQAEATLQLLRGLESINIEWTTAAAKLRDDLNHHIYEEETKVFAAARQVLLDHEAEQMAAAFFEMKREVAAHGDLRSTLTLVANLMPPRFAEQVRRFESSVFKS